MPKGIYSRTEKHLSPLIKRNRSIENRLKVSKSLKGHGFSENTLRKLREKCGRPGDKNPNWKGDSVGVIGIHIWIKKNFAKKRVCEFCGFKSNNPLRIDFALIKGMKYERKRENFIELCRSCHSIYDGKGKHLND